MVYCNLKFDEAKSIFPLHSQKELIEPNWKLIFVSTESIEMEFNHLKISNIYIFHHFFDCEINFRKNGSKIFCDICGNIMKF